MMDIAFDSAVADRLVATCRDAARTLEGQRGGRQSAADGALHEFRGAFANAFRDNVWAERGSRTSLTGILEGLAAQVKAAQRAAVTERARLAQVAAWNAQHLLVPHYNGISLDDAPRPDTTPGDRPQIFVPSARQELRGWPGGGTSGSSSADPDELESAAAVFRRQDDAADTAGSQVIAALGDFEGACSWALIDADGIRSGFRRFVNDNRDDTTRLTAIAGAFRAAGGTGDIGAVTLSNAMLVLAEAPATLSSTALLSLLSTATPTDLKALVKLNGWQQTLQALDPGKVATWWASMDSKDSPTGGGLDYSLKQALLLSTFPAVLGSLDGMPALARVRANQLNASALIRASEQELAQQEGTWAIGQPHGDETRKAFLREEIEYLKQVQAGTVQLYLYNRDHSRIIEMVGTPSRNTQHVLTFVPGTYTSLQSFYGGSAQQVSVQMASMVSGTVAFVYKDGLFPGENDKTGAMDLTRITEANDEPRTLAAGRNLASFETTMRTDPLLGEDRDHVAFGWSWGLANVTSSEVAGAHYNKVISLSGAGMPPEWRANPTTQYTDISYRDMLQAAQTTGNVWNGNVPRANPAFDHGGYYVGPNDASLTDPSPLNTATNLGVLMDNHTLIASNTPANRQALDEMAAQVRK